MNPKTSTTRQPGLQACRFSMIEVVLGLGLIAFGLISIAALFPVGLRANQAAIGETYAAEHADQFLHLLKSRMTASEDSQANWSTCALALPETKPSDSEPTSWDSWLQQGMVTYSVAGTQNQFYRIRQEGLDKEIAVDNAEEKYADDEAEQAKQVAAIMAAAYDPQFQAVCRVWRTPVTIAHYESGTWQEITFTTDQAIGLNVEISWPADKPYASRQKSLYQLEVHRPEL